MNNPKNLVTLFPVVFSIAILLNLLVYQSLNVFYPEPEYPFGCYRGEEITVWESTGNKFINTMDKKVIREDEPNCQLAYNRQLQQHALVSLFALLGVGILSILSSRNSKTKAVELGLSYGGAFLLLGSLGQLYNLGSQAVQVLVILLAFAVLMYFASKRTGLNLD